MKKYYSAILLITFCSIRILHIQAQQIKSDHADSVLVATVSLGFYNWYLNCLKQDSTYNIIQPLYHWEDNIPVLETQKYIGKLS